MCNVYRPRHHPLGNACLVEGPGRGFIKQGGTLQGKEAEPITDRSQTEATAPLLLEGEAGKRLEGSPDSAGHTGRF